MSRIFPRRGSRSAFGKVLPALLILYALTSGEGARAPRDMDWMAAPTELVGRESSLVLDLATASLVITRAGTPVAMRLELSFVTDGNARSLPLDRAKAFKKAADLIVELDADPTRELPKMTLRFSRDDATDAFVMKAESDKPVALRFDLPSPKSVFIPGTGGLADLGSVTGNMIVLDDAAFPFAVAMHTESLTATMTGEDENMHLAIVSDPPNAASDGVAPTFTSTSFEIRFVTGKSSESLWSRAFASTGEKTKRLKLLVTGTQEEAHVYGSDEEGNPVLAMRARSGEHVEVDVPPRVQSYYAAIDSSDTSAPIRFEPGLPWDLKLDVSAGGELDVRVIDGDTGAPLTSRIVVHGIDGTLDPTFGPDYRGSGAGPIMDSLKGDVSTPLPAGRYRVLATKGIEYNVDAQIVDIESGHKKSVDLELRHVVETPNMIACDLHVHARPSFDTPVTQEDRVLSLVSAGIEFAVPTEHNIVGDYSPSIAVLDLARDFSFVPGVEVTTYSPRFGHFGVFPYPLGVPPPYKGTNIGAVFAAAHAGDPKRVLVVHHPRLPKMIGYFDVVGFDPKKPGSISKIRTDFDALEIYNGYEKDSPEKVQRVLDDYYALLNTGKRFAATGSSDSHRIQYQWAGYPRTMVLVDPARGGVHGKTVDVNAVVSGIKHAHALVTSGPIVEISVDGKGPGDEVNIAGKKSLSVHVRVRAAPWIDVTSLDVVAEGQVVASVPIESHFAYIGKEVGSDGDLAARVLRYEGNISFVVQPGTKWVLAIARGTRKLDDILPFMPVTPMGVTNPVWLVGN